MSNITVKGFDYVSFWREDTVGVIVLRTDSSGKISSSVMGELMMAIGKAAIDDEVKSIALTGQNFVFCKGLVDTGNQRSYLEQARALASTLASVEKPTFALINGDAFDFGYELALLCDRIIAAEGSRLGFYKEYSFVLGGSVTSSRFQELARVDAKEGSNCDLIINRDTFLEDSKGVINKSRGTLMVLRRRMAMRNLIEALDMEHLSYLRNICAGNEVTDLSRKEGVNQ
jgi:Enoyl-CoA hydratase/carnithine racemase